VQKRFLSVKDLSTYLNVPVGTIYSWVHLRKIPHCKMGKTLRFDLQALEGWIRECEVKPHSIWRER